MTRWLVAVASLALSTVAVGCSDYTSDAEARSLRDRSDESIVSDDGDDDDDAPAKPSTPSPAASADLLPDGPVQTVTSRCTADGVLNGNGEITRVSRDFSSFVDVDFALAGKVVVQEGPSFGVRVEVDSNLQDSIVLQKGGTNDRVLHIGGRGTFCLNALTVLITMPKFHGLRMSGGGKAEVTKNTGASEVALEITGAGNITFRGNATTLGILVSGAGDVLLDTGAAQATRVTISGAGDVARKSFDAGKVTKKITGAGDVAL